MLRNGFNMTHAAGVAGFGVETFDVNVSPTTAGLLFLLAFFSFIPPGVVGLFSPPLLGFFTGTGRSTVFSCGAGTVFAGVGAFTDSKLVLFVDAKDVDAKDANAGSLDFASLKFPGSPTKGFSSMYSLP